MRKDNLFSNSFLYVGVMEGAVSSFCKTLMVAISYEDSGIMEYSLWVGGETIVTYNIGEVHLICSQL